MKNLQINKDTTKLIRIDRNYHKELKILAAKQNRSIKDLLEQSCRYLLNFYKNNHAN